MWDDMVIVVQCCFNPFQKYIYYIYIYFFYFSGWWYTYPSKQYESQL